MKLEVVTLPVSDVDRAKRFYQSLGWRLDADIAGRRRLPGGPGHADRARSCSIAFGKGLITGRAWLGSAPAAGRITTSTRRAAT